MLLFIVLLYMSLASTFTFLKAILFYAKPIFCIAIRMICGGFILLTYYYIFSQKQKRLEKKDRKFFLQIVLFHIYFSYILEAWALVYVTSSKTCLLYNLSPFVTALFSYFLFKERLTLVQWLGLMIGFLGFLPILTAQAPLESLAGQAYFLSLPEFFIILSAIAASYGWIVMKTLTHLRGYSPIFVNGLGMLGGGLLSLVTSFLWEESPRIYSSNTISSIENSEMTGYMMFAWYTILLIVFGNIIAYNLYGWLLRYYSATFLSFAGFTTPLFAAFFGWLFLNEHITWYFLATTVIVSYGLYLFYKEDLYYNNKIARIKK